MEAQTNLKENAHKCSPPISKPVQTKKKYFSRSNEFYVPNCTHANLLNQKSVTIIEFNCVLAFCSCAGERRMCSAIMEN